MSVINFSHISLTNDFKGTSLSTNNCNLTAKLSCQPRLWLKPQILRFCHIQWLVRHRSLNNYLCFAIADNFSLTKIIAVCQLQWFVIPDRLTIIYASRSPIALRHLPTKPTIQVLSAFVSKLDRPQALNTGKNLVRLQLNLFCSRSV